MAKGDGGEDNDHDEDGDDDDYYLMSTLRGCKGGLTAQSGC